jgi:hypothetical protein
MISLRASAQQNNITRKKEGLKFNFVSIICAGEYISADMTEDGV